MLKNHDFLLKKTEIALDFNNKENYITCVNRQKIRFAAFLSKRLGVCCFESTLATWSVNCKEAATHVLPQTISARTPRKAFIVLQVKAYLLNMRYTNLYWMALMFLTMN